MTVHFLDNWLMGMKGNHLIPRKPCESREMMIQELGVWVENTPLMGGVLVPVVQKWSECYHGALE